MAATVPDLRDPNGCARNGLLPKQGLIWARDVTVLLDTVVANMYPSTRITLARSRRHFPCVCVCVCGCLSFFFDFIWFLAPTHFIVSLSLPIFIFFFLPFTKNLLRTRTLKHCFILTHIHLFRLTRPTSPSYNN